MQVNWPRVRDLPEHEQPAFTRWLQDQTHPLLEGVPDDEQDAYYQHDYERWKQQGKQLEQNVDWD